MITWNYHQHQTQTGFVELSNIVVEGVADSDAGSFIGILHAMGMFYFFFIFLFFLYISFLYFF